MATAPLLLRLLLLVVLPLVVVEPASCVRHEARSARGPRPATRHEPRVTAVDQDPLLVAIVARCDHGAVRRSDEHTMLRRWPNILQ